jgi:zinc transport system substrate-binding protein
MKCFAKSNIVKGSMFFLSILFLFNGCKIEKSEKSTDSSSGKLKIVSSLYPQYDFARQIFGEKADVSLLLPPGTESHNFDPSSSDISKVYESDLFIYTNEYMEPWASKIINSTNDKKCKILDVSSGIEIKKEEEHGAHEGHHHGADPHMWLDPTLAIKMAENIEKSAVEMSPQDGEVFTRNSQNLKNELTKLDEGFRNVVDASARKCMVFAGKFAFSYFTSRYNLEYKSTIDGCTEDAEPSAKKMAEVIDFVKDKKIPVIFHQELSELKLAGSLAEQTNTTILRFNPLHNITKDEKDKSFVELMSVNLENLQKGLT